MFLTSERRKKSRRQNDIGFNSISQSTLPVRFDLFVVLEKWLILDIDERVDFCIDCVSRNATLSNVDKSVNFCVDCVFTGCYIIETYT